eukprot:1529112-Prymnesium_polylepis.2
MTRLGDIGFDGFNFHWSVRPSFQIWSFQQLGRALKTHAPPERQYRAAGVPWGPWGQQMAPDAPAADGEEALTPKSKRKQSRAAVVTSSLEYVGRVVPSLARHPVSQ